MSPKSKGDPMVRAQGRTKPDRNWYPENFDWYIKWIASILILISLAMRSAGIDYRMYDLGFGLCGIILWTWVSIIWRDRALIMLNAISGFMLAVTILREW
jgi:hypothetical protein